MGPAAGSYEISHSSGTSLRATTKLRRGVASYTADTREACLPSSEVAG